MNTPAKKIQDDALIMIHLRNQFYKKKFYFVLAIYVVSLIVIGFLIWALYFLVKNPPHPLYFVADSVGRLIQDPPRNVPNMSNDEVSDWTVEAVENALSYDYVNYRLELQNAQKYFNDYGWRNYLDSLRISNNLVALTGRKYIIIAKVVAKPKLVNQGILGGAYAWKFELRVLMTYMTPPYDEKSRFQNPVIYTVVVQRQSILTSYKGLGIIQLIGSLVTSPAPQNLATPPQ